MWNFILGGKLMNANYKWKLFFILFLSMVMVTFSITLIDYMRMKERILEDIQEQIDTASNTATDALQTIDKVYHLLDKDIAPKMEENTQHLQEHYVENPALETWDYQELASRLGMDIYMINNQNVVVYSNIQAEVGLDFASCCKTLARTLDERRQTGQLYIDGIDINQQNGEVKKFSYMATFDKKYVIELGYSLQDEVIFDNFNFLTVMDELAADSSIINAIHVLNFGGNVYGSEPKESVPKKRREAFEKVRETNEVLELEGWYDNEEVIFRYVPYTSEFDQSATKLKVLEIIYHKNELHAFLQTIFKKLMLQLLVIIIIAGLISSFIANWFAKPIYFAYHDSLTGLKNRTAFDSFIGRMLKERNSSAAFLMLDLDNFKLVNDHLGHRKGDLLLQKIACRLQDIIEYHGCAFRLGGDEFAVILKRTDQEEVEKTAMIIINALNELIQKEPEINDFSVSVSIGIALTTEGIDQQTLFDRADFALYESKKKGKNQYQLYRHHMNEKDFLAD